MSSSPLTKPILSGDNKMLPEHKSMTNKKIYIGFDFDGTLAGRGSVIHESLILYLKTLSSCKNIILFLSSGRDLEELLDINKKCGSAFSIISAENGGIIYNISHGESEETYLFENEVGKKEISTCIEAIQLEMRVPIISLNKKTVWSGVFGENLDKVFQFCQVFIKKNKLNISVYAHHDERGVLDIVPHGVDKVNILKLISKDAECIHYFGDSCNDIKIMSHDQVTPHTVYNATDFVKEIVKKSCGFISEKQCGEGVLEVLKNKIKLM